MLIRYRTVADIIHITKENIFWYMILLTFNLHLRLMFKQPNDEREQDRLDLVSVLLIPTRQNFNDRQSHHIYLMLLKGELLQAPVKNPKRVLDLGTGTGLWAIEYAE